MKQTIAAIIADIIDKHIASINTISKKPDLSPDLSAKVFMLDIM